MTESTIVLLACLAVIALMAVLIYRRVLNDAHKQIHAVSKWLEKPAR